MALTVIAAVSVEKRQGEPQATPPLTAVLLILALAAVVLAVAAEDPRDAATRVGAFELAGQANVNVCRGNDTQGDHVHFDALLFRKQIQRSRVFHLLGERETAESFLFLPAVDIDPTLSVSDNLCV